MASGSPLADLDGRVGLEGIGRHRQIEGCRPFANAAGGIVLGPVAGAQPTAELAAILAELLSLRNAAEMRADADDDQPLLLARLDASAIGLRIAQLGQI